MLKGQDQMYLRSVFRYRFGSLLSKIFVSYVLILLIVIITNITIYYYVEHVLEKKETSVNKDYLNYVSRIVDGELLHIKEKMYGFLQTPDISKKLLNIKTDINNQSLMMDALLSFKNNSQIISHCFLYNKELPFVIGDNGSEGKSAFMQTLRDYYGISDDKILLWLNMVKDFTMISNQIEKNNTITLIAGASYSNSFNRLIVTIDEKEIYNVITDANIVNYGSAYMIDQNGHIVSSSETSQTGGHFNSSLLGKMRGEQTTGTFNDHDNLVVYQKSKSFDGYFVTVIPYANILKNTKTIRNIFMYALMLLVLIGSVIAGMYGRMIYHPIAGLLSKFKTNRMGERQYKNEIDLISGFIDHIQTNNSRYEEDRILGRMIETETYGEEIRTLFPYDNFQAAVITYKSSSETDAFIQEFVRRQVPNQIIAKVTKGLDGDCYFIANGENLNSQAVKHYLLSLKISLETEFNVFSVMGIGEVCSGLGGLRLSLKQALIAMKQGSCYDEICLFEFNRNAKETFSLYFPIDFDHRIADILTIGAEEKVEQAIHHIFEQNKDLPQLYMRIIYTKFIDTYIMIANKRDHKFVINDITDNVENEFRAVHVKNFITKLYVELIPLFYAPQDTAKRVEQFIIEYIERNYSRNDITIEEVADAIHLSSTYVSTLFKKSSSVSFSQYLLDYRIKKAIELLLETDYSVKAISQMVGSGTYNSFIRSFRIVIGISPGEYRILNKVPTQM